MVTAKLIGRVWSTRKYEALNGMKLMLIEVMGGREDGNRMVAVDTIGAGVGDRVIVSTGSAAWRVLEEEVDRPVPVDAVIVGILDEECDCMEG